MIKHIHDHIDSYQFNSMEILAIILAVAIIISWIFKEKDP